MKTHSQIFHELSDKIQKDLGSRITFGKPQGLSEYVTEAEFSAAYARSVADTYLRYIFRKIAECAKDSSKVSLEGLDKMLKSGVQELDEKINLTTDVRDLVLDVAQRSVLDYASSDNILFRVQRMEYEFRNNAGCISFL